MRLFFRGFEATLLTVVRALGLYFGFYLGVFVISPFVVTFDAWSFLPLWAWMSLAVGVDVARSVALFSPRPSVPQDVRDGIMGSTVGWAAVGPGLRHRQPRCSLRSSVVASAAPLHRRVRFGRTRLR